MERKSITLGVSLFTILTGILICVYQLRKAADYNENPPLFLEWYTALWWPSSVSQFVRLFFSALLLTAVSCIVVEIVWSLAESKASSDGVVFLILVPLIVVGFWVLSFGFAGIVRFFWSLIKAVYH